MQHPSHLHGHVIGCSMDAGFVAADARAGRRFIQPNGYAQPVLRNAGMQPRLTQAQAEN